MFNIYRILVLALKKLKLVLVWQWFVNPFSDYLLAFLWLVDIYIYIYIYIYIHIYESKEQKKKQTSKKTNKKCILVMARNAI